MKLNKLILAGIIAATSIQAQAGNGIDAHCSGDNSIGITVNHAGDVMTSYANGEVITLGSVKHSYVTVSDMNIITIRARNVKTGGEIQFVQQSFKLSQNDPMTTQLSIEAYDSNGNFIAKCGAIMENIK